MKKCNGCGIRDAQIKELEKALEKKDYALKAAHGRIETVGSENQVMHKIMERTIKNARIDAIRYIRKRLKEIEQEIKE